MFSYLSKVFCPLPVSETMVRTQFSLIKGLVALLSAWLCLTSATRANHYSGATISYNCLGGNFYTVFLDVYLDCAGVPITAQTLNFSNSCGVVFSQASVPQTLNEEISPLCPSQLPNSTCSGGLLPGFRRYRFATNVYLSPCNYWTIGWSICCRNTTENVLNTPGTYAEATLNNAGGFCDNSPRFADNGVPYLCVNSPVSYNPGASDPNGHDMAFTLVAARFDPLNEVTYQAGFSGVTPIPGISINAQTGQLNFFPTVTGNYVVVIRVATYNASNELIGIVMRDLMFVVMNCAGSPPAPETAISNVTGAAAVGVSSVAVCTGVNVCASLVVTDADPSSVLTITSNATTLLPGSTFVVTGTNPATARVCWTGNTAILPVNILITIDDGACPVENTATRSIYFASCNLLPVELVSFTAVEGSGHVLTEWITASEMGSDHFVVERSSDAVLFHSIGAVDAAGNSQQTQRYSYKDDTPLEGLSYYRLRETDLDGSVRFSDIVAVQRNSDGRVHAERLADGSWMVRGMPAEAQWRLTDVMGRNVQAGQQSIGTMNVQVSNSFGGVMILTVLSNGTLGTMKLPELGMVGERVELLLP